MNVTVVVVAVILACVLMRGINAWRDVHLDAHNTDAWSRKEEDDD